MKNIGLIILHKKIKGEKNMKKVFMFIFTAALIINLAAVEKLNEIKVRDVKEKLEKAGMVKDVIIKTEVITEKEIEKKQASTLSEAVENETGIQTSTGCSMCGMKRIRINGMKGEHTTVLIDDVPMHSTVSGYYGMDALTTAGIASIEVARGSGASLIAPGAIGGVINIKSKKATENSLFLDMSGGNDDFRTLSISATNVANDGKTRSTVIGQYNKQGQWDADENGVNEAPEIENYSTSFRFSHDVTDKDNFDVRVTAQKSDVFGGPVIDTHFLAYQESADRDPNFDPDGDGIQDVNDDLNLDECDPMSTLEAITTKREEAIAKWTHQIDGRSNFTATTGGSNQTQDSVYEGADYYSQDKTYYGDVRYNNLINDAHLLTAGIDTKQENLEAESKAFFAPESEGGLGLDKDEFKMSSYGFYLQDIWTPTEKLEISAALRLDKILVDWTAKTAQENEIDEFVAVPRLHIKWDHNDNLTSRISAGMGYRAPLTFFESEHGILEDGFGIDVDQIEKSTSAAYSVSFDNDKITSTLSSNLTMVNNLAIIAEDETEGFVLQNSEETHNIIAIDGVIGYQIIEPLNIAFSYEHIMYNDEYKAEQFLAQVEDRAKIMIDFDAKGWMANLTTTWVGSRDLTEYGYEGYDQIDADDNVIASSIKDTEAPAYFTMDAKLSKAINDHFTFYIGAKNALDYTQAGDDFSPLMYDADGGYDVGYIWGPLRGRQIYSGIQAKF